MLAGQEGRGPRSEKSLPYCCQEVLYDATDQKKRKTGLKTLPAGGGKASKDYKCEKEGNGRQERLSKLLLIESTEKELFQN